jgi:alkylation response protein AidB-like acyl-CoA dehydrogenase
MFAATGQRRLSGTMCLTEPQCGTDLGLIRTKATPAADGS